MGSRLEAYASTTADPDKDVLVMSNLWLNSYRSQQAKARKLQCIGGEPEIFGDAELILIDLLLGGAIDLGTGKALCRQYIVCHQA